LLSADAALPFASVTVTVKEQVPDVVGTREISPVDGLRNSPAGSEPEAMFHLYGVTPCLPEVAPSKTCKPSHQSVRLRRR